VELVVFSSTGWCMPYSGLIRAVEHETYGTLDSAAIATQLPTTGARSYLLLG
jgi:hypothetical protein